MGGKKYTKQMFKYFLCIDYDMHREQERRILLQIRLTADEMKRLQELADSMGISKGSWIRVQIHKGGTDE